MSKSLGNVVLANDALNKFGGNVLRQFFLTTYYRSPINYTDEAMQTASEEVDKYQRLLTKFEAKAFLEDFKYEGTIDSDSYNQFLDYLADDLNVANAITVLSTVIKKANNALRNPRTSKEELSIIYLTLRKMLEVLGFNFENFKGDEELKKIYSSYLDAKSNKDFALSDELRKVLMEKGVL
jgi:cysteinyl-tRNA synthetase